MKPDQTIRVAVAVDVRGRNNRRCGVGCWGRIIIYRGLCCDVFLTEDGDCTLLRESKLHPGEYLRCRACRDAEVGR